MVRRRLVFTFPSDLIKEPIIYELGRQFDVVTNVRRADVVDERGWVVLELDGTEENIDRGIAWAESKGVRVDPVQGDVLEG